MQLAKPNPMPLVMGGFHLSGEQIEEIISDTVKVMQPFGRKRIVPTHCIGWRGVNALANIYADDTLVSSAVGLQFAY